MPKPNHYLTNTIPNPNFTEIKTSNWPRHLQKRETRADTLCALQRRSLTAASAPHSQGKSSLVVSRLSSRRTGRCTLKGRITAHVVDRMIDRFKVSDSGADEDLVSTPPVSTVNWAEMEASAALAPGRRQAACSFEKTADGCRESWPDRPKPSSKWRIWNG